MQKAKSYRNLIWGCCMTGIAMFFAFFFLYHTYIQDIIYEERLNQMEEITRQMFQNLEDVIDSHWDRVTEECNYLRDANIQTTDELCRHMKKKYELSAYADHKITLMAVDSEGGYYTESGNRGLFRELDYFEDNPERISFVFDSMTDNQSEMVFLNHLPEPIELQNGEKKTTIRYFGIAQDMEQLNPYFNCDAYDGNNSVYVLDDNGFKLFNSNQVELIKGHNVFSVLQNMKYLHNSSFEKTKAELEEKGCSYSNAVLDGTEYFYGLKRMENAEWTLIFLVPAEYVAANTLKLVNFVTIFIVIFTVIVAACVILGISFVMHRNQQEAIRVEQENNAKLETVNTKLRQAKQAAEEAFQVAQEASRSKSSFLANMSHDIRTPMNAIIGYAELMERHWGDNELTTNYLHKLKGASQFLLALIGNVLEIARIESGKETLNEAPWNLKKINDTLEIVLDREILNKQLHVARNIEIQHADVYCDSLKIQEIIMNLVSNAIKYTPDGGKIDVDIEEMEAVREDSIILRICVSDTGIGISQKYIPHIFEAFTREKNSSESGIMGTGLGLRIVKSFVDLMDGSVIVQSEPGKGSSFIVEIPCRIVSEEERIDQAEQSMPENFLKCKRILLVEDNELNVEIARTILQDVQAEVEVAADGAIAVAMLQKAPVGYYDVILMDIQMPKMNGYQATEAIRKLPDERAQVPIIAMTANAFEEDRQAAFAAGMDDYLAKPIEIDKLLRKIVKVLEKK